MKKIGFIFFTFAVTLLPSCDRGAGKVNEIKLRTPYEITLEKEQIHYIQYDKSNLNDKVPTAIIFDQNVVRWIGNDLIAEQSKYDAYNGYYPIYANNVGTTYVTFTLSGYTKATVKVNVIENNYVTIEKDKEHRGEAIYQFNKLMMKKTPSIKIPYETARIVDEESKVRSIMDYVESAQMLLTYKAHVDNKDNPKYMKYIISYFDITKVDYTYNPDLQTATTITNANSILRREDGEELIGDKLPIDNYTDTFEVTDSDQLWWCVEYGYRPIFKNKNSSPAKCYQKAREICSKFPKSILGDNVKIAKAVYEHCIDNYEYNYYPMTSPEKGGVPKFYDKHFHSAYLLEGPLLYGKCVCDGYCKVYTLLCGMLGTNNNKKFDVVRSTGFDKKTRNGHGYNYVSPTKEGKDHYLVCPTWGLIQSNVIPVCLPNYSSFLQSKTFFLDLSGSYDFDDLPWTFETSIKKMDKPYYQNTVLAEDGYLYDANEIETKLKTVFEKCDNKNLRKPFVVSFACTTEVSLDTLNTNVKNAKNNVPAYSDYFSIGLYTLNKEREFNKVHLYSAALAPRI